VVTGATVITVGVRKVLAMLRRVGHFLVGHRLEELPDPQAPGETGGAAGRA
jgi:hypothetical protein